VRVSIAGLLIGHDHPRPFSNGDMVPSFDNSARVGDASSVESTATSPARRFNNVERDPSVRLRMALRLRLHPRAVGTAT
jgi:hypothetical protein